MEKKIVKYQPGEIIRQANNYLGHLNYLTPEKADPFLIPYRKGDKWGFCTEDKKIVIDCIYDEVALFSKFGNSDVMLDGRKKSIKKTGETNKGFDYNRIFCYGDIEYLDGEIYDATKYWDTHYWCKSRYYYYIEHISRGSNSSSENLPENYKIENLAPISMEKDHIGFINCSGEVILDPIYESANFFYEDVALVGIRDNREPISGFINKSGDFIFPPNEDIVYSQHFSEGLAYCVTSDGFGFINKLGEIVIPCIYWGGADFSEGIAGVKLILGGKCGYINKQGDTVIPFIYDNCGQFSEGMGAVTSKENNNIYKCGHVDIVGNMVIPMIYESVSAFKNGLSKVKFNSKWGYINKQGVQYWED